MLRNDFQKHSLWAVIEDTVLHMRELAAHSVNKGQHKGPHEDMLLDQALASFVDRTQEAASYVSRFRRGGSTLFSEEMLKKHSELWKKLRIIGDDSLMTLSHPGLSEAHRVIDEILRDSSTWPTPPNVDQADNSRFADLERRFQVRIERILQEYENRGALVSEKIDTVERHASEVRKQLEESEYEFSLRMSQQRHYIEETFQTLTATDDLRKKEFQDWLKTAQEDADAWRSKIASDAQESLAELSSMTDEAANLHEKTLSISGATSTAVLAAAYSRSASTSSRLAIGSFILGLLILGLAFWQVNTTLTQIHPTDSVSWQWVGLKIALTTLAAAGASVLFGVGSKYFKIAETHRRVDLELRAIGPFLADLEDQDSIEKAKLSFVDRTFGHAWDQKSTKDSQEPAPGSDLTPARLLELLVQLVDKSPGK